MQVFFFFFQAEDGIRDVAVTGVQTCALPISRSALSTIAGNAASEDRDANAMACAGAQYDTNADADIGPARIPSGYKRSATAATVSATTSAIYAMTAPAATSPSRDASGTASAKTPIGANLRIQTTRSEEHTSELQSRLHLVCRLLLEKKKKRACARR